jgi:hypothetical protein
VNYDSPQWSDIAFMACMGLLIGLALVGLLSLVAFFSGVIG